MGAGAERQHYVMDGASSRESGGVAEPLLPSANKSLQFPVPGFSPYALSGVLKLWILGPWPVLHQGTLFPSMASKCWSCIIINFSFLGQMRANLRTSLRERTMSGHGHHLKAVLRKFKIQHAESLQVWFFSPSVCLVVIVVTGFRRRSLVCVSDMNAHRFPFWLH